MYYGYRISIIKFKKKYIGLIRRGDNTFWFQNQIKFEIPLTGSKYGKLKYYRRDHTFSEYDYFFDSTRLDIIDSDVFIKINSESNNEFQDFAGPYFNNISDSTSLIHFLILTILKNA